VLRDSGDEQTLRDYLIATAARLLDERGSAGLTVRDIAREAKVADGSLYNHFADKEELLAHALYAHVGTVMHSTEQLPRAGEGAVEDNLRTYITSGLAILARVMPAFAGFLGQPGVIARTGELMRGDSRHGSGVGDGPGAPGLPTMVADYLRAEQELGRVTPEADVDAAATLIVGACHEFTLPRMLFNPSAAPVEVPAEFVAALVRTVLHGIAPPERRRTDIRRRPPQRRSRTS
jgi:AcrR family transcriptional regulator